MRETDTHYYFYHHQFGQWSKFSITDHIGITYTTCEQYMMYHKAILFNDLDTAIKILSESDPKAQKALGRLVKNFDAPTWDRFKCQIVFNGNLLKFSQHDDIRKRLIETGDKILVEASPVDKIWGVGLSYSDDRILDERNWKGQNLLGKCLMQVRNFMNDGLV